jgi:predicted DNA-binding transcriptional regulator AlpA
MKKLIRKAEAAARLGVGLSTFHERYVATGRLRLIYLGKRSVAVVESDIDGLIDELIAQSENHPERRALAPQRRRRTAAQ